MEGHQLFTQTNPTPNHAHFVHSFPLVTAKIFKTELSDGQNMTKPISFLREERGSRYSWAWLFLKAKSKCNPSSKISMDSAIGSFITTTQHSLIKETRVTKASSLWKGCFCFTSNRLWNNLGKCTDFGITDTRQVPIPTACLQSKKIQMGGRE